MKVITKFSQLKQMIDAGELDPVVQEDLLRICNSAIDASFLPYPPEEVKTEKQSGDLFEQILEEWGDEIETLFGGDVFICEDEEDLKQVTCMDIEFSALNTHYPNILECTQFGVWDACNYLQDDDPASGWAILFLATNESGGPMYYIPSSLWEAANIDKHMRACKESWA